MKYNELYSEWYNGIGAVAAYTETETCPWHGVVTQQEAEIMFATYSYDKTVLPMLSIYPVVIPTIFTRYTEKWKKLWNDFVIEYNPISPYTLTEDESTTRTRDVSDNLTHGKKTDRTIDDSGTVKNAETTGNDRTVTQTASHTGTTKTVTSRSGTQDGKVYGFNSNLGPAPSDQLLASEEGTTTETPNTTDTTTETGNDNGTRNNTETRELTKVETESNTGVDKRAITDDDDTTRKLTKSGNIGYTAPQTLLREDIELWAIPYFNIVFTDLCKELFLQVY